MATWNDGDEGWEVDWCKELPSYPDDPDTIDRDGEKRVCRNFRSKEEADAYVQEVLPKAVDKDVRVTAFALERLDEDMPFHVQNNCYKEYTSDTEFHEWD